MRRDESPSTPETAAHSLNVKSPFASDAALISACRRRDTEAWAALIARYQKLIYGMARKMGLSANDAEDVFQNVCVILYQHLDKLRDSQRLAAWLASVTQHEVAQWYRKQNPAVFHEGDILPVCIETAQPLHQSSSNDPEQEFLDLERQHLVQQLMSHLSGECQCLLKMLYGTESPCTYAEIAETLSLPLGSIGPKRARCLQHLRKMLGELGY